MAAGPLTPGGPTNLVTINPGSNTLDVLAGLGGGRFANPVTIDTSSPAQVVRMADFTGNGIDDLAVLTANGLSIYLGNGQGGFLPPATYACRRNPTGLTVADLTGNGKLDLLVGNAYGDVLVLHGQRRRHLPALPRGQPGHRAWPSPTSTGNGAADFIYADQGLDRVVVDYGASQTRPCWPISSTGLLAPGAVALADLNGDGIPDLIVANSGGNNVLIYPGLGNGQFGPAINDGNGYFVGTDPVGITVANLTGSVPDLIVADEGSNDVSILLNQSQGGNISFAPAVRFPVVGWGPVATAVQNVPGGYPNLLVSNSGSNTVTLLPGRSPADFDVSAETSVPVGTDPGPIFVGIVNGQTDLVTVNAGSNDLTLISGFGGPDPVTSTIPSGGIDPDAAFAFSSGNGFEDLVVGNAGDGELALFEGGPGGLSLMSDTTDPNLPSPTAMVFAGLAGGAGPVLRRHRRPGNRRVGGPEPGRRNRSRDHAGPLSDCGGGSTGPAPRIVPGPGWNSADRDRRVSGRSGRNRGRGRRGGVRLVRGAAHGGPEPAFPGARRWGRRRRVRAGRGWGWTGGGRAGARDRPVLAAADPGHRRGARAVRPPAPRAVPARARR